MSKTSGTILVIDDDEDVLLSLRLLLKPHVALVQTENTPQRIPSVLHHESFDVILLDMNFTKDITSGAEGFYWLDRILEMDPSAVVVLITAYGDVELAVQAIKAGATDFVLKPWQNEKLVATLSAAMKLRQSQRDVEQLRLRQHHLSADLDRPFQAILGTSPAMQAVLATIQKVAPTDATVLILGENGTGKELVARELHRRSCRAHEVFLGVDMGAISETLFESELFGHVKGAFTDAREDRAGRFEVASGGTLFLDEMGNLPLSLQAKLLTVLETREVTRLGSNTPHPVDIRLICATNLPLYEQVAQQRFRQDLLYRINTVEIRLPPLRERREDVPLLVEHFLALYARKYHKPLKRVSAPAMTMLEQASWPGNVRELQHAIERAVILSEAPVLQSSDFLVTAPETTDTGPVVEEYNLEAVEKVVIQKAISAHRGNISQAARVLGLTRAALYRRLEWYGL